MIRQQPGKVTDGILLLGKRESNVYLVDGGSESALLGGGIIYMVPDIVKQVEEFHVDEKKISRMVILHSHFDHVGLIPFLKKKWPWAMVCGSSRAKELLSSPKVIESIRFLNRMAIMQYHMTQLAESLALFDFNVTIEKTFVEGEKVKCGDLTFEIMEVPGHSSCSLAIYIPEKKALFASDAGGIPAGKNVLTAANSNYDHYMKSLERMAEREVEFFLPEHNGAVIGDEAHDFMKRSIQSAIETRAVLEAALARNPDVKSCTEEITGKFMTDTGGEGLPKELVQMVVSQMLNYLSKRASVR